MPISHKWISATNQKINYPRCKAKNSSHSTDAHSQNVALTVLLSLLPINTANISVMYNRDQITLQLAYLHDYISLTLRWRSLECIVHSTSSAIDNCCHNDRNVLVAILTDWHFALWQSRAQEHFGSVSSDKSKINLSCKMICCACYTSLHQPIFRSYCSPFAHNIFWSKTLGQAS